MNLLVTFQVTDEMKKTKGGGVAEEGELIDVVEIDLDEVKEMIKQKNVNLTPPTLYGCMWFLLNKC